MKSQNTPSRDLSPPPFDKNDVRVLEEETLSHAYAHLKRYTLKHRTYDRGWSDSISRELYDSGDAVTILPFDPDSGYVALVEQFRIAAYTHENCPWIVETIAGRFEKNEDPVAAAIREAREEAGIKLGDIISLGGVYAAPGIFNEYVHLYCGRASLNTAGGIHGLDEEHEDIRVIIVPFEEAYSAIQSGRICDATTIICLQWLAINKNMLIERWRSSPSHLE